MHITEYLAANITSLKPYLTPLQETYVYHDPCTLSRKLEALTPPHTILEALPGITLKKPYLHGKDTQCCGYGSSLSRTHPDLANTITKKLIIELHKEADHIITACPTCKTAFQNQHCTVSDISELIYQSVKPINE
jgi:Fe-S oxidoreductase